MPLFTGSFFCSLQMSASQDASIQALLEEYCRQARRIEFERWQALTQLIWRESGDEDDEEEWEELTFGVRPPPGGSSRGWFGLGTPSISQPLPSSPRGMQPSLHCGGGGLPHRPLRSRPPARASKPFTGRLAAWCQCELLGRCGTVEVPEEWLPWHGLPAVPEVEYELEEDHGVSDGEEQD